MGRVLRTEENHVVPIDDIVGACLRLSKDDTVELYAEVRKRDLLPGEKKWEFPYFTLLVRRFREDQATAAVQALYSLAAVAGYLDRPQQEVFVVSDSGFVVQEVKGGVSKRSTDRFVRTSQEASEGVLGHGLDSACDPSPQGPAAMPVQEKAAERLLTFGQAGSGETSAWPTGGEVGRRVPRSDGGDA